MPKPEGDIIASSPIVREGGCQPYRIVIRDLGNEFVVHTQVLPTVGGTSYMWGHYFRKDCSGIPSEESEKTALRKSWLDFEKRSRDALSVSTS
jgi:hypothetical protein